MSLTTDIPTHPQLTRWRNGSWYRPSLSVQILVGTILGGVIGWLYPSVGARLAFLRDIFLNLIKSAIAPLVFSTLVVGVAGAGDLKSVGRMGLKTIVYFEIVTTFALLIGLGVVNLLHPGAGVVLTANHASLPVELIHDHPRSLTATLAHVFPASVVDAMARNDLLQIVAFASLFAIAILAAGEKGAPVLRGMESLSQVMFVFIGYIMKFAPIGVGAAMASTIGDQGLGVLANLAGLIGAFYLALILFVAIVFGAVMIIGRIPLRPFLRAVGEPALIALTTTSSESALPKAILAMERFGVPARVVGFVMPTGYSFNLDGAALYLGAASIFIAQASETTTGQHLGFGRQVVMLLTLMVTSKGGAGVPRAALVILLATVSNFLPEGMGAAGLALIFGVDTVLDMGRACVNLVGNCLASVVVARWEGVFDETRARAFGHSPVPTQE